MQALLLAWSFWYGLISQELVVFYVTSMGGLSQQANSHKNESGTDLPFCPCEWHRARCSISCGKTPLCPAHALPKTLVTNVLGIFAICFATFSGYMRAQA